MGHFFITGYPRSRTAWLANLFTTGPLFCHHDLTGKTRNIQDFRQQMRPAPGQTHVGDADTGLPFYLDQVMAAFSDAAWVVINRPFAECWSSFERFAAAGAWKDQVDTRPQVKTVTEQALISARPLLLAQPRTLWVRFEQLDEPETIERIWRHCVPDLPFDGRRVALLETLNVQLEQRKRPLREARLWTH